MLKTKINDNYTRLEQSYLFSRIAHEVAAYRQGHPGADIISLGIGDVTLPIVPAVVRAMQTAVSEMGEAATMHGYGPEQGYDFLRQAIALGDYEARGIGIRADEIFISDGAKSDLGNLGDIFSRECVVAVTDPVYPVYADTNIMAGRRLLYLPCTPENDFVPQLPEERPDLIYLCYPNNPTGTALTRSRLKAWVEYALKEGSLIIYDSAYEAYISRADIPHSVYEIEGATECAIEVRSFSKTAGFTGLRCGYTVVPAALKAPDAHGRMHSLRELWLRRQTTKFNGASYPVQRAAEAIYTPEGRAQTAASVAYYMRNAALLRDACRSAGMEVYGGVDAPYVWARVPGTDDDWHAFRTLLEQKQIVCTPGSGFGACGRGFIRLTAFNTALQTQEACRRLASNAQF